MLIMRMRMIRWRYSDPMIRNDVQYKIYMGYSIPYHSKSSTSSIIINYHTSRSHDCNKNSNNDNDFFTNPTTKVTTTITSTTIFDKISRNQIITWYSCGPTVYDDAHLGHARTYVSTDIIRRILVNHFKCKLHFALGVTDIDDKIINKAKSNGLLHWDQIIPMVRKLEYEFFYNMESQLFILPPTSILRVSEHIDEIIKYIHQLIELNHAYITYDGIYFDLKSMKNKYDKFNCIPNFNIDKNESHDIRSDSINYNTHHHDSSSNSMHSNGNIDNRSTDSHDDDDNNNSCYILHGKRNKQDFALWKNSCHGDDDDLNNHNNNITNDINVSIDDDDTGPSWISPWGRGRPGWHIECSAMTHALFGKRIDIHSGGIDLKFPHHTNEIAQCEAHNCSNEWVDEWFHFGHLHIEGRKMSKSLKNFISINDYMNSKITKSPGDDFRIYCLQYKYHASLTYSIERIYEAEIYRKKVENFIYHMKSILLLSSYQTIINNNNINNKDEKYSNDDVRYTHKGEDDNDVVSSSSSDRSNRDCNKPTVESKRIMDMFFQTSISIDEALRDDFDTPKVLNLLSQLMSECHLYSQLITSSSSSSLSSSSSSKLSRDDNNHDTSPNNKNYININHNHSDNIQQQQLSGQQQQRQQQQLSGQQQQPIQPIIAICTYIGDLLTMLGLQFPSKINASKLHEVFCNQYHDHHHQHYHSSRNSSSGSGDSYQISASDIDMILQFRANIRNTIVKNLKSIKEKKKSSQLPDEGSNNKNITQIDIDNEHSYQYLLKQCDNSREQLSQMLNIKIEDINNNSSTWRPLD